MAGVEKPGASLPAHAPLPNRPGDTKRVVSKGYSEPKGPLPNAPKDAKAAASTGTKARLGFKNVKGQGYVMPAAPAAAAVVRPLTPVAAEPAEAAVTKPPAALTGFATPSAAPGPLERATAWAGETGPKVLKIAEEIFTVYGAASEADRTAELERRNNRGPVNEVAMWGSTFVVGVMAGALDDMLATAATAASGSPAPVTESWDRYGSGPIQHAAGESIRGFLDWGAKSGW